jgi:hypothetical protein
MWIFNNKNQLEYQLDGNLGPIIEASGDTDPIAEAASLNFTLDSWAFPLLIDSIKVVSDPDGTDNPSTDFTFSLYETVARTNRVLRYQFDNANSFFIDMLNGKMMSFRPSKLNRNAEYGDGVVAQSPFFCTITNTASGAAPAFFFVEIRYRVQGGPVNNVLSGTLPSETAPLTNGV